MLGNPDCLENPALSTELGDGGPHWPLPTLMHSPALQKGPQLPHLPACALSPHSPSRTILFISQGLNQIDFCCDPPQQTEAPSLCAAQDPPHTHSCIYCKSLSLPYPHSLLASGEQWLKAAGVWSQRRVCYPALLSLPESCCVIPYLA